MTEENPLTYISNIQELMDAAENFEDDDLQHAIDLALKLIVKPEVPNHKAAVLVVKFEAYSFKFKMMAVNLMGFQWDGKPETKNKKNFYFSLSEQCHNIADALKIQARYGA